MADESLRKYEILRGRAAYQRLLSDGARVRGKGVTLFFSPSPDHIRRVGTLVPRRLYGTAVGRNRARRRLREFYRRNRDVFPLGHELIIRLHQAPDDWNAFFARLERLLAKA